MSIDFKDKVAIVTGAGGGLGREYALELGRRGAKVVVNDLGGSRDGTGHSDMALQVVEEIEKAGGEALDLGIAQKERVTLATQLRHDAPLGGLSSDAHYAAAVKATGPDEESDIE